MRLSLDDILGRADCRWLDNSGRDSEYVLSTRVRMARNVADVPFPQQAKPEQLARVIDLARELQDRLCREGQFGRLSLFDIGEMAILDRRALVERHLMSMQLLEPAGPAGLIINDEQTVSIMVNEEDHFRIQCLESGLDFGAALDRSQTVDDVVEAGVEYAFDEQLGYLTSCPTNVGTGLRASVMMHLSGLVLTGQVGQVVTAMGKLGVMVRGFYGEGTQALGNIFQISNQVTLGRNEAEITRNLEAMVTQIIRQEEAARQELVRARRATIEDRVWRAYGALERARVMTWEESAQHLSDVRLGVDLGLVVGVSPAVLNRLLIAVRPAFLERSCGEALSSLERRVRRADVIRRTLAEG